MENGKVKENRKLIEKKEKKTNKNIEKKKNQ